MTINLQPLLYPRIVCVPSDEPDTETGCRACGDNARSDYEQCRQAYYLKKQTELLESEQNDAQQTYQENVAEKEQEIIDTNFSEYQQIFQETLTQKEQNIKELKSKNRELEKLFEGQNGRIDELVQGLEQQEQETNVLTASLKEANLLNFSLFIVLGAFLICAISILIKKNKSKNIKHK